ncbi:hypothetical protein [Mucilaginibacter gotjawali]|uniref:Uncharacterized protein n=2 Tax=Mucilaginibacter gotjawali TaxID=1550579 RepID=A0A0X8X4P2_9SPHI|nr:hypothetical protein [Mucilaginibacter gotjawali]MBB3058746.1 hypothetical protein [Mucilaginibacter gotjawali]BAU55650.1 hypothetical protein MgSA37_03841 [Mucilaginibacter gotjawali]
MLFLDDSTTVIIAAKAAHESAVRCLLGKKLRGTTCGTAGCAVCAENIQQVVTPAGTALAALMTAPRLSTVISGEPKDLFILSNYLWAQLVPGFSWKDFKDFRKAARKKAGTRDAAEILLVTRFEGVYKAFKSVFDYTVWFSNSADKLRYDAYQLAANLGRNTCTYCNRIYTHTMKGKGNNKIMRPQFDHWFSKSKHPALALSFYNLIPCCSVCNSSIKGSLDFDLSTHVHPYVDKDCLDRFAYSYHYTRSTQSYAININPAFNDKKIFRTYSDFKLKEVFNSHHAELADLIRIKEAYSKKYIERLMGAFPGAKLAYKEVYRLAFGVEYDESDFYKKPLSKFKKDILRELKLIK